MHDAFTEPWAEALGAALNSSTDYRVAAATWEGDVAFVMDELGDEPSTYRAVVLDLWHGACRSARLASDDDLAHTPYVLRANRATWEDVLAGRLEPIAALMLGRIKLVRGSMGTLALHMRAAREIVFAAAAVTLPRPSDA